MKTYELHTLKDGKWKIDSVFDDSGTAVEEAKRAQTANRYTTIKVIEENHDPLTNEATVRTIFLADGGNHPNPRGVPSKPARPAPPPAPEGKKAVEPAARRSAARPAAPAKRRSLVGPLLILLVLGVAALAGLHLTPSGF